jgi:hypothetical protein
MKLIQFLTLIREDQRKEIKVIALLKGYKNMSEYLRDLFDREITKFGKGLK